jgi:hypothetical protein
MKARDMPNYHRHKAQKSIVVYFDRDGLPWLVGNG